MNFFFNFRHFHVSTEVHLLCVENVNIQSPHLYEGRTQTDVQEKIWHHVKNVSAALIARFFSEIYKQLFLTRKQY